VFVYPEETYAKSADAWRGVRVASAAVGDGIDAFQGGAAFNERTTPDLIRRNGTLFIFEFVSFPVVFAI
jgi:hypothetical protein